MESEDDPTRASARLREYARLRGGASEAKPARGYWLLMLWSAALIAAYVAVFLISFGGQTVAGVPAHGGYSATSTLLAPVLIFSSLVNGARERFRVRRRVSRTYLLLFSITVAGFIALCALSIAGVGYPWWLNLAVPIALFASTSVDPVRGLLATPRASRTPWRNAPLRPTGRVVTALIGLAIGVLLAAAVHPLAAAVSGVVVLLTLVVMLLSWRSSFGLPRLGYEWGPIHWGAFGVCAAIAFASVTLTTLTDWFAWPYSVGAGVLVIVVMTIAAMRPTARDRRGG